MAPSPLLIAPLSPSTTTSPDQRRQRLPRLDDVGAEHLPRPWPDVEGVVRRPRRDEEAVPGVQHHGVAALDAQPHRPGEDVAHLLAGMGVPAGLDPLRDQGQHLHDLPSGHRERAALHLGALQRRGQAVGRTGLGHQLIAPVGAAVSSPSVASARMITSMTACGCEIMITCEPSASAISAPARWAIDLTTSAPAAWSPVATTAQDGRLFHAGAPFGSVKPTAETGRWVAAITAACSAGRAAANTSWKLSAGMANSTPGSAFPFG